MNKTTTHLNVIECFSMNFQYMWLNKVVSVLQYMIHSCLIFIFKGQVSGWCLDDKEWLLWGCYISFYLPCSSFSDWENVKKFCNIVCDRIVNTQPPALNPTGCCSYIHLMMSLPPPADFGVSLYLKKNENNSQWKYGGSHALKEVVKERAAKWNLPNHKSKEISVDSKCLWLLLCL